MAASLGLAGYARRRHTLTAVCRLPAEVHSSHLPVEQQHDCYGVPPRRVVRENYPGVWGSVASSAAQSSHVREPQSRSPARGDRRA